jgi:general secretion pathway protein K
MRRGDSGYAMIAAVAGIAVFSLVAFDLIAANRGAIALVQAQAERARLSAAADAGLMRVIHGLGIEGSSRWPTDGRPQTMRFGDVVLTIAVEDERGRISLNRADGDTLKRLFAAAGADNARAEALAASVEDWRDSDDEARPGGAEAPDYAALGITPRNGGFRTVEELMQIKGMDAELYRRVAPALTVFSAGGLDRDAAHPLALAATSFGGGGSVEALEREWEAAGQRTALAFGSDKPIVGRALTVRIAARSPSGALERVAIVELTGDRARPYWIRYLH